MARKVNHNNKFIFSVLFDQGLKQLELQSASIESMEAKTGYLMAGEGVVLTLLGTFATQSKNFTINFPMIIGIVFLMTSLFYCILALWNRHLQIGIGIKDFYRSYIAKSQNEIRFRALNILNYDYELNQQRIVVKASYFQKALTFFGLSLLFLVVGVMYQVWYTTSMSDDNNPSNTKPLQQDDNNRTTGQNQTPANQHQNWQWTSISQNMGTIAADVIKGNEDLVKK